MSFAASLELIGAWRFDRLPLGRYAPLAGLLAWAAAAGSAAGGTRVALASAIAFTLVAQFRLWDDLADRARDAREHPQRVLVRASSPAPLVWISVLLVGVNALGLALASGPAQALALLVLSTAVLTWYRRHRARGLLHTHVLLLKYPAFVWLLATPPPQSATLVLAALCIYCALAAFELMDDAQLQGPAGRGLLALHLGALALIPAFAASTAAAYVVAAVLAGMLGTLWLCVGPKGLPRIVGYLPLLAAVIDLAYLSLRGTS